MTTGFLLTSLIVIVSPGTGVLYTLAAGLSRGSRASVIAAFGCTLGIVPHMAAAILGLAALLYPSGLAFEAFKYAGVAYLLYLAWNALKEPAPACRKRDRARARRVQHDHHRNSHKPAQSQAVDFLFAFLPRFVAQNEAHPLAHMLMLSALFMLLTFVVRRLRPVRRRGARPRHLAAARHGLDAAQLRRRLRGAGIKLALTER